MVRNIIVPLIVRICSVNQDDPFDYNEIIETVIAAGWEGIAQIFEGLWEGFVSLVTVYMTMDNVFYLTLVLIALLTVYILVWRFP